jgi:hypothetical protein
MTADDVLVEQRDEARRTADNARKYVELDSPALATDLYRRRLRAIEALRRQIARDSYFNESDKARVDAPLKIELEGIERLLNRNHHS